MIRNLNIGLSALESYSNSMNIAASNIANINSLSYKVKSVTFAETLPGVKISSVRTFEQVGFFDKNYTADAFVQSRPDFSSTYLAAEVVNQIVNRRAFSANIKTIQTADETLKAITDMKA